MAASRDGADSVGAMNMRTEHEKERRLRNEPFWDSVVARHRPDPERKQSSPSELSDESFKLLVVIALRYYLTLLAIYKSLGFHPAEGKSAIDDLLARGLVRLHRIARRGRGGQPQVVELRPRGRDVLATKGITPTPWQLKRGGFVHAVYGHYVGEHFKSKDCAIWYERTLGDKAFDLVVQDAENDLSGIEIYTSGNAKWVAEQSIKGAAVTGIKEVIVAVEKKTALENVKREISAIDALGLYKNKIRLVPIADYIELNDE